MCCYFVCFFVKQKTAYEMRISDWSSDVCSSDLTSLLHILSGAARDAGYLVLYQSCDADSDFDGMFRSVLGQIPKLYHGGIAPTATSSEVGASIDDLTGAKPLSPRHVTDLLAPVAGTRIILMLDEFARAPSLTL